MCTGPGGGGDLLRFGEIAIRLDTRLRVNDQPLANRRVRFPENKLEWDVLPKRQREGLEVIGLQFEYGDDPARAFRQIDSFKARYKLPYPLLLAGQPTPESTRAALGSLGPVKVYPSTIFIGRDGRVREVHVGWAGPATGALNVKAKRDFDATVTRLLREKA